ncbi:MAG: type VI secretion system baseplate subunit TssK [Azoarcus sp.]|jgi:type VI secretion system protein ImpJ|nr:type VI secretion system baseplate subunit TssK [Azoarcus sp.]
MSYINKVVWSEGMFLRPQHFQQQERYIESYVQRCVSSSTGFFWGFSALKIDPNALKQGMVVVQQARGVMPDGTPFDLDEDSIQPLAFDFPPHAKDVKVCLVLPPAREGEESVIYDEKDVSAARFGAVTFKSRDGNEVGAQEAEIQVGRPRFRLELETSVPHGWTTMGMLKAVERQVNNELRIDPEYIPPTLHCGAEKNLSGFLKEVSVLLKQRGEVLAGRLSAGGRGGISEVGDFLLLTFINRWHPLILHLATIDLLHPERLYADLICLGGELGSFSTANRRAPEYPVYVHDDLQATFRALMNDLRKALAIVLDQTVIRIELETRKFGIRIAVIPDRTLLKQASFVLAMNANMPPEKIQAQFPAQTKIGPVEKIRDLINLHLPGVSLRPLPVAPRELPFHTGFSYFEIDTRHELWQDMEKSAAMALHIAGDFPGLALECWAIRK